MDTITRAMSSNWKFHLGELEDAWFKGYDDSSWRTVIIPHDWSVEHPFSEDYSSGTGYLKGGIGWYRLSFTLPEEYQGKKIRIVFDGIYKNSQVWCNSYYLGKRPSGYTTFSYDLTPFLGFGKEENQISVKVTHTDLADSRWFTGSGITRNVSLVVEEEVHPVEYGIFFTVKSADSKKAELKIRHSVVNDTDKRVCVKVMTLLKDRDNQCVMSAENWLELESREQRTIFMEGEVLAPACWSPNHPDLYQMETYYTLENGMPYLVHKESVGIRTFHFDPERGFFLNGVETKIKGVCVHHDGGCLGGAMRKEVWERRLEILKECGCNAIRCSHNPHMPELYELCDQMGFLIMDEAFDEWENAKNKWSTGHNVYPPKHQGYFEDFPQWHEADLKSMVKRDRNHPSVILWSIGNEIDYPNDPYCHPSFKTMTGNNDASKPEAERQYDPNRPSAERLPILASRLASMVREEDTTRPVTLAAAFPELSSYLGFFDSLDVVGYNYKEHLYEADHKRFPGKPLLGSENGHSFEAWCCVRDNPYISGQFLWTGIDYLGEAHGWPIHGSGAGFLTCAGFKKPEFYRRKSFWSEEPVLHITVKKESDCEKCHTPVSDSWNFSVGDMVSVICYSNFPEVALRLNGIEVERQREVTEEGAFCFRLPYEPGILEAIAYDSKGNLCQEQALKTTGKAERIHTKLWQGNVLKADKEHAREIGYLYQLEITLLDQAGNIPVWDDKSIKLLVTGEGELAGLENGNLSDTTSYTEPERSTFQGQLIGYIRRKGEGKIKISITADLPDDNLSEIEINSVFIS